MKKSSALQLTAFLLTTLMACQQGGGNTSASDAGAPLSVQQQDPSLRLSTAQIHEMYGNATCNPLNPSVTATPVTSGDDYVRGLVATITTPNNGQQWNNLDAFDNAATNVKLDNPIYFDALNVPTRPFSEGFPTFTGGMIEGLNGQVLLEYFRLDFSSSIGLTSTDEDGDYEFAALADDGARVVFNGTNYINDPGITPSKLMCGTGSLHLDHDAAIPLTVNYFQGPRYKIALQLFWRKADPQHPESACGQSGDNRWYDDSHTPPTPQPAMVALESRGWSVVPAANYRLPSTEYMNPCTSSHVSQVLTPVQ